jgi:dinuclear metal center YbgI/SA1388 family protein
MPDAQIGEGSALGATASLQELTSFCDKLLDAQAGADYCPNGLQVEGKAQVAHLVTAVSANMEIFSRAIDIGADAMLVHHGILWNHDPRTVVGPRRRRLRLLMDHDLSVLAYHLPLDRHLEVGNAAALINRLGCKVEGPFGEYKGQPLGVHASVPGWSPERLREAVHAVVGDPLTAYMAGPQTIRTLAVVTGGGTGNVNDAIAQGFDAYLTGEVTEWTRATVQEAGIHYLAGGHYRTERYGVQEVGARVQAAFGIKVTFLDIPNPV